MSPMYDFTNLAIQNDEAPFVLVKSAPDVDPDISIFSSKSKYEDDDWYVDLYYEKQNLQAYQRTLHFDDIPDSFKPTVKRYAYKLLTCWYSLHTITRKVGDFKNIISVLGVSTVGDIDRRSIQKYYDYVMEKDVAVKSKYENWGSLKHFLQTLQHPMYRVMNEYHLPPIPRREPEDGKYIPDYVVEQLDAVMFDGPEMIPCKKLAYWLLRMYPCRATETFSTPVECLRHYKDSVYVLNMTIFKTSAGNQDGQSKLLLIDTKDKQQKYLYNLIRQQQKVAKDILSNNPDMGDFLFTYVPQKYKTDGTFSNNKNERPVTLDVGSFNCFLDKIISICGIEDENSLPAHITSHEFRHNAITDRLESKLFRPIDLRPMTGHANEQMVNHNYHHKPKDELIKQMHSIEEAQSDKSVIFHGKVIGSKNDAAYNYFMKQPFAFEIGHMGICTDIRDCAKDKTACLSCRYFIPNADDLLYFKDQKSEWEKKLIIAEKIRQTAFIENIKHNIKLFDDVITRIENAEVAHG